MKLPDFVQQNNKSEQIIKDLKEDCIKRSKDNHASVISPSHITECLRRMYYRLNWQETSNYAEYTDLVHHQCAVEKWATYFSKCNKIILVDKDILVAHSNYNLSGTVDHYIESKGYKYAVKIKQVPSADFKIIKKGGPKRKHVIETIVYLWLSEFEDGLLVYEDNDTQEYDIYHIISYEPIIKTVKSKCRRLINHKMRGVAPPRITGDNAERECSICEYSYVCLKQEKK